MSRLPRRTYRLGLRIGRAWARRPYAAERLTTGTRLLARRAATRAADWIRAGRRNDLTGWRAALGPIARIAVLALGLWVLWRVLRAVPVLLWLATPAWLWGAWRAGRDAAEAAPEAAAEHAEQPTAAPSGDGIRALLLDLIGDRSGVHLTDVLTRLQEGGHHPHLTVPQLRSRLASLGIPVRRSLKVRRAVRMGVHRDDIPAPSPPGRPPAAQPAAKPDDLQQQPASTG